MNSPQVGQIKTIKGKQYRLNRAHRWERLPEPDHGHNSPVARALHTADHLGESVVSWKVGKLLGGPIGAIASAAGYDAVQSKIIAETAVQAATATAIHAIKEQRSGTLRPVELGAYFLTQSSAAFLGKQAHHGVEEMAEAMHLQEVAHFMAPLLAGKITGISTVAAANKTGIYQKAFDMVVEKGKHDVTLLSKFFGGFGKSADDSAIAQLLFDLTEAAIAIAVLSSRGLKKSGGTVYYSINSEVYEPRRDRLHGLALFKTAKPGSRLIKSNEPIKYVMRWKKIPIGVTHDPGDKRHGRVLPAGYGHIRGSYGDAEDGMSLDIYLGPDLGSDRIFKIKQVVPDTGELDEYKYVIGCWDEDEARNLFCRCMPRRFCGGVESASLKSLEKYQVTA